MVYISWILFALMGSLGIYSEQASSQRLIWLLGPFLAGLSLLLLSEAFSRRVNTTGAKAQRTLFLLKLLCVGCVILMEYHSKYSVNDLLNWLYLPLLLSAYTHLDRKGLLWFIPVSLAAMSWKYLYMALVDSAVIKVTGFIANLGVLLLMGVILYLSRQLSEEKERLLKANGALTDLTREIEGLTVYRERQYIAREIHDTVGHGLTALVMKLEMSKLFSQSEAQTDKERAEALLTEAIDDGRLALRNTREVVETMNSPRRSPKELRQLFDKSASLSAIALTLEGEALLTELDDLQSHCVYRAVQEALTNCLKYSSATAFSAKLTREGQQIYILILDNGQVDAAHSERAKQAMDAQSQTQSSAEGMGLKAMAQRVERAGGTMVLAFDHGFEIRICFNRGGQA